jgi:hypothetical protein
MLIFLVLPRIGVVPAKTTDVLLHVTTHAASRLTEREEPVLVIGIDA